MFKNDYIGQEYVGRPHQPKDWKVGTAAEYTGRYNLTTFEDSNSEVKDKKDWAQDGLRLMPFELAEYKIVHSQVAEKILTQQKLFDSSTDE